MPRQAFDICRSGFGTFGLIRQLLNGLINGAALMCQGPSVFDPKLFVPPGKVVPAIACMHSAPSAALRGPRDFSHRPNTLGNLNEGVGNACCGGREQSIADAVSIQLLLPGGFVCFLRDLRVPLKIGADSSRHGTTHENIHLYTYVYGRLAWLALSQRGDVLSLWWRGL